MQALSVIVDKETFREIRVIASKLGLRNEMELVKRAIEFYLKFVREKLESEREPKLYWIEMPKYTKQKDILIFDAGYRFGDIHIYEYKESIPIKEVEKEAKELYGKAVNSSTVIYFYIKKRFGREPSGSWRILKIYG